MKIINTVKRFSAAIVLAVSIIAIPLGVVSAAAILAIVAAPFVIVAMAINFMGQTKGRV